MDYEKAYKEALERAKYLKENTDSVGAKDISYSYEYIFPELKESEDERIRKELIRDIDIAMPIETAQRYIAWLEKQGEKSVDESEPKFKAGDWITNDSLLIGQVTSFDGEYYHYMCEGIEQPLHISNAYNWHLWTIQDAKDGDVLCFSDETIVIFKDLYNATTFHSYCHIEDGLFAVSKDDMPDWWEGNGFQPATKEQRDILFQKMKEAGYEWDADKKELNKIEQKHYCSEEDEKMCESTIDVLVNNTMSGSEGDKVYSEEIDWLKSIKKRVQQQTKQEWSEEDSERIARIHKFIWANRKGDTDEIYQQEQDADWLMTLKPQPKQEWSEKDREMLDNCLGLIQEIDSTQEEQNWLKSLKPNTH